MYIPKHLQLTDKGLLQNFISHNSFGIIITADLNSTYLPFTCDFDDKGELCLFAHMAKANPHWQSIDGRRALVVFSGPHAYISPNWYVSKPAVPTWNYVAVHCYGRVSLLDDNETLHKMNQLVAHYEPGLLNDETVMPKAYQQRLRQAVVGFKLEIDDIQGKEKLGQHRSIEDQQGVFNALSNSKDPIASLLAEYMKERELGIGKR